VFLTAVISSNPLSRREREVAELVAHGLTNREIAERLFISERTAEGHVQSIRNKLGCTSRAQIAAWTVQQRGEPSALPLVRRTEPAPAAAGKSPTVEPSGTYALPWSWPYRWSSQAW